RRPPAASARARPGRTRSGPQPSLRRGRSPCPSPSPQPPDVVWLEASDCWLPPVEGATDGGTDGATGAVDGVGTLSKAATAVKLAVGAPAKQVLEPLPLEPLLELLEPPELESPIWEWSRPTLVAPSISSRAATKEATASWPGAQPESSSAGPLTPLRRP